MSRSPKNLQSARRGFTLIEVLISLAILALTSVVLGAAYLNVLNSYQLAGRDTQADQDQKFAISQLLAQADIQKAQDGAEFDSVGGRHVRWKSEVETTNLPDLYRVNFTCEISDPNANGTKTYTQSFRLLRPTWSDASATDRDKLRSDIAKTIQDGGILQK